MVLAGLAHSAKYGVQRLLIRTDKAASIASVCLKVRHVLAQVKEVHHRFGREFRTVA